MYTRPLKKPSKTVWYMCVQQLLNDKSYGIISWQNIALEAFKGIYLYQHICPPMMISAIFLNMYKKKD